MMGAWGLEAVLVGAARAIDRTRPTREMLPAVPAGLVRTGRSRSRDRPAARAHLRRPVRLGRPDLPATRSPTCWGSASTSATCPVVCSSRWPRRGCSPDWSRSRPPDCRTWSAPRSARPRAAARSPYPVRSACQRRSSSSSSSTSSSGPSSGLQVAYLFGGLDTLDAAGITYAQYARRGFFELVAAACLAVDRRRGPGGDGRAPPAAVPRRARRAHRADRGRPGLGVAAAGSLPGGLRVDGAPAVRPRGDRDDGRRPRRSWPASCWPI